MPQNPALTRRSKRGDTPHERLRIVTLAAFSCISRTGFKRTQMADVAEAANLSPAALYSYASGKDALLTLAFLHATGQALPDTPLPVKPMPMDEMVNRSEAIVGRTAHWPLLEASIKADAPPDIETLRAIGGEVYDVLATNKRAIWLIDRLSLEVPEMAKLQAERVHGAFLRLLIALISKWRAPGIVPDVAARNAVEMMAWPAMHRHRDAWLQPAATEEEIRETAIRQYAALLAASIQAV